MKGAAPADLAFARAARQHFRQWLAAQGAEIPRVKRDEQYSGSRRAHYGIRIPQLKDGVKAWLRAQPDLTRGAWLATLDALYGLTEAEEEEVVIEERLLAGLLLSHTPRLRKAAGFPLERLDAWLGQLEGWIEIDTTCQATFSLTELVAQWDEWAHFLQRQAASANINRQRAALVLPIGALRERPSEPRLFPLSLALVCQVNAQASVQSERDKRVVKALSWILREACKQYAPQVADYLAQEGEALPALVQRETRIKLASGVKNPRQRERRKLQT
ncbi:MAG: DNA alkylation repair protein [Chloroflexi bacterium]|nr:DNA alkylation repair protein [Chloroflexota bacterium]